MALLVTLVGFVMFRDVVELPEKIVANLSLVLLAGMLLFVAAGDPSVHARQLSHAFELTPAEACGSANAGMWGTRAAPVQIATAFAW